ncbi:uncharacterized protein N7482_000127 [Penicillium canariense]|uniref:Uncharacterized protein n=1 Tax=Penicillium canariense TaxID=189055 RepID=A0A9W9IDT6_9EURO|nr:uncharacterized protein N7482_000127 [Penicillium canariense]KAJ5174250.1 hypothetical protein N7482_000127 [Penicillium canariense]
MNDSKWIRGSNQPARIRRRKCRGPFSSVDDNPLSVSSFSAMASFATTRQRGPAASTSAKCSDGRPFSRSLSKAFWEVWGWIKRVRDKRVKSSLPE